MGRHSGSFQSYVGEVGVRREAQKRGAEHRALEMPTRPSCRPGPCGLSGAPEASLLAAKW